MMAAVLDPTRRIVDPHHHLWSGDERGTYLLEDLYADVRCGHNVVQTVFVECRTNYRRSGPEHLRPVGQTEWVEAMARASADGPGPEIAGIVAFGDLSLGPRVEEVLDAHAGAAGGRLRGIRHPLARGTHRPGFENAPGPARAGLAAQEPWREGVQGCSAEAQAHLRRAGSITPQILDEFIANWRRRVRPTRLIILNHCRWAVGRTRAMLSAARRSARGPGRVSMAEHRQA